ncbi:four helix bundle protein [bacterium]|nr:four helix bundle protein [bacterium]
MTEKLTDFRQLNVWQKAHKLVLDIYEITKKFPKEEKNELVSRMRKAAMDVPIKIAEGFMRRSPKDKISSYKATLQALEEVKYYLILSKDLEYFQGDNDVLQSTEEVGRMLTGLVRSVRIK